MKYNFERFLALLLVACTLAGCGLASSSQGEDTQTIAQRMNAPDTVILPAVTPGKHSTLAFDAKVIVPEVNQVPILQVKIDDIPEETIFAAADALGLTDINRKASAWDYDVFRDGGKTKKYDGYASGWRQFYAWINYDCEEQPKAITYSNLYSNYFKKAEYYIGQLQAVPYPDTPREGTMTRDAAYELALDTIGAFTQGYDYALEVDGALGGTAQLTDGEMNALRTGKKDPKSVPKYPYAFAFYFAPVFEGIPMTQTDNPWPWISKEQGENLGAPSGPDGPKFTVPSVVDSRLLAVVLDEGVHAMQWTNPLSVMGTLQEDAQLLPFEEILEKAKVELGKECVISERGYETHGVASDIVVMEIRFGYACKQMEPGSMDLRLMPVWDFIINDKMVIHGEASSPKRNFGQTAVTLSAEDGSVVYRFTREVH